MGFFSQLLRLLICLILLSSNLVSCRYNVHFTVKESQGRIGDEPTPSPPPPFSLTPIPAASVAP
ncbi:hypothetical protein BVC80_441g169 [Macleaya cordata]|uniref:Uncharacterized protein n=1 Tax=Macleaya cordata TaxID=56857 RepID=A0A200Q4K8_MACCD|nr:hypothetical protein BVC80_441g169 [Macleaya cordata]